MTVTEAVRAQDWVASAVACGIPGATLPVPDAPLAGPEWAALVQAVRSEHLSGLLLAAIEAGQWPATDEQRDFLWEMHLGVLGQTLFLERTLLAMTDALDAADIETRVLKGPAVAHLDYASPGVRAYGDLDLLVRADDLDRVEEVLSGQGGKRVQPAARPGFDRRFGKSFTYRLADGHEVDVHRTFVMGPYGLAVDLESVWGTHTLFRVGDKSLAALADEARLLHAAFGTVLSDWPPRLRPRRDLAEMVLGGVHDAERVIDLAKQWRAEAVLASAVTTTWESFQIADVTALSEWARHFTIDARDRRLLALYRRPDPPYSQLALHSLGLVPGVRDKAAFVTSLALPSRQFLKQRGTSWPRYIGRGTVRALGGGGRRAAP